MPFTPLRRTSGSISDAEAIDPPLDGGVEGGVIAAGTVGALDLPDGGAEPAAPTEERPLRLTPDGHVVAPGALAQGFPWPWPELRIEAVFVTVEPDTFQGRVLCNGVELGTTEIVDFEPNAILLAEQLIYDSLGKLFQTSAS